MNRSTQAVRLAGSIMFSAFSAWFVVLYTRMSLIRFESDHPDQEALTPVNTLMVQHSYLGWLLPIGTLVCALTASRFRSHREVMLEVVIQLACVLALGWAALPLLCWQIQNIPLINAGRLHY